MLSLAALWWCFAECCRCAVLVLPLLPRRVGAASGRLERPRWQPWRAFTTLRGAPSSLRAALQIVVFC